MPKMMTSEVEKGPRLVTGGYGRQSRQWVKLKFVYLTIQLRHSLVVHYLLIKILDLLL